MMRSQCLHPLLSFNSKPPFLILPPKPFFGGGRPPRLAPFCRALAASSSSSSSQDPRRSREPDLELFLHSKPSPIPVPGNDESPPDPDDALAPFLKFFKSGDPGEEDYDTISGQEGDAAAAVEEEEKERVSVQYYEPKPGDLVVGVVVSGNENRLDVSVGADVLGAMLTKEVLPLYEAELPYLLCDREKDAVEFSLPGKMGVLVNEDSLSREKVHGRPVVEVGTILFAEVLGRTLSGRPLLSTRRMFRRVAWHRVRQVLYAYSCWNS